MKVCHVLEPQKLDYIMSGGVQQHSLYGITGLVLGLRPADGRRHYFVTTSLIGPAQAHSLESALYTNIYKNIWHRYAYVLLRNIRHQLLTSRYEDIFLTFTHVIW